MGCPGQVAGHEEGAGDAACGECFFAVFADFSHDAPLLVGDAFGEDADGHGAAFEGFDTGDGGFFEEGFAPAGVDVDVGDDAFEDGDDSAWVFFDGDGDVDGAGLEALGAVGDAGDLAVADVPDDTGCVAESGDAQGDFFDGADGFAGVDEVTDAVLVFEHHE